jgi:FkbM family methyltransferase
MASLLQSLRGRLRRIPVAAFLYHRLRESLSPLSAAETPYGFRLGGNAAMRAGGFEPEEVELVRELLAGRDALVDVGANVGLYTCLARSLGKRTIAVEPHPANLRVLRANLAANGWQDTEIVAAGLSDADGEAELLGSDTGASLLSGWAGTPERTLLRHRIRLTTLDALLGERFAGERLLVKIDIEGAEHACLRGAAHTLDRSPAPTWLVEVCLTENFPGGRNPDFVATFDLFFARGYRACTANRARRPVTREDVARWAAQGRSDSGAYNYLFTR